MKKRGMVWCAISVMTLALFALPQTARAVTVDIYDDFGGDAIDATKWYRSGGNAALFSESGGSLNFQSGENIGETRGEKYSSTASFSEPFLAGLNFSGFSSTNSSSPSESSVLGIYLGWPDNYAGIARYSNMYGSAVEIIVYNATLSAPTVLWYTYSSDSFSNGSLGLYYDGSAVFFSYRDLDSSEEWQGLGGPWITGWPWEPMFPSSPGVTIAGYNGTTGVTSFSINDVFIYRPVPIPSSLLLLAPGMAMLLFTRKKLGKIRSAKSEE